MVNPLKSNCLQLLSIKHHNFSGYVSTWAWVIDSTKYFGLEAMLIGHKIFMSSASRVSLFWLSNPLLLDWTTKDYTISKASAKQHQNTKIQMDERALILLCHLNQWHTSAIQRWILAQTLIKKSPRCLIVSKRIYIPLMREMDGEQKFYIFNDWGDDPIRYFPHFLSVDSKHLQHPK